MSVFFFIKCVPYLLPFSLNTSCPPPNCSRFSLQESSEGKSGHLKIKQITSAQLSLIKTIITKGSEPWLHLFRGHPLIFVRHLWLFYLLIYLFISFYFRHWFLGHRVEAFSCFKWTCLFLSGRLFFLQGLWSKHASFSEDDRNSRDHIFLEFFLFCLPLAPVVSKIGPRVIPPDLSRAPAELRAKRSFSQVPSGGRIQRSFPPSPTYPKCIWETFKTPLKREGRDWVHVLYLLPLNSQEMWTRAAHEMFIIESQNCFCWKRPLHHQVHPFAQHCQVHH